jgi:hypothetical protein
MKNSLLLLILLLADLNSAETVFEDKASGLKVVFPYELNQKHRGDVDNDNLLLVTYGTSTSSTVIMQLRKNQKSITLEEYVETVKKTMQDEGEIGVIKQPVPTNLSTGFTVLNKDKAFLIYIIKSDDSMTLITMRLANPNDLESTMNWMHQHN